MKKKITIVFVVLIIATLLIVITNKYYLGVHCSLENIRVYNINKENLNLVKENHGDSYEILNNNFNSDNLSDYKNIVAYINIKNRRFERMDFNDFTITKNDFVLARLKGDHGITYGVMKSNTETVSVIINTKNLSNEQVKEKLKNLEVIVNFRDNKISPMKIKLKDISKIEFLNN